ncbi:MAG: SGNH/GDSL hydrolase family protein [Cyanobacteria bacterium P01_D01_bin.36]
MYKQAKTLIWNIYSYWWKIGKRCFCEEILILGDSHASIFEHSYLRSMFPKYYFHVVSVGGATVSGLENPNSKTQALPIFIEKIKKTKASKIIVSLGEVDTGFVIWYKSQKNNVSMSEVFRKAIANYQSFLLSLSEKYSVMCISTPLPTIQDGHVLGDVANARNDVSATQGERTALTLQFNDHMHTFCKLNRILYLSFDEESLGKNGLVRSGLLSSNPTDHHYSGRAYAEMIVNKLKRIIE